MYSLIERVVQTSGSAVCPAPSPRQLEFHECSGGERSAQRVARLMMAASAADGSWDLTIYITDLDVESAVRVRGDLHVAGLMLKLVDAVGTRLSATHIQGGPKSGATDSY